MTRSIDTCCRFQHLHSGKCLGESVLCADAMRAIIRFDLPGLRSVARDSLWTSKDHKAPVDKTDANVSCIFLPRDGLARKRTLKGRRN
jgi:hypothetical protein